MISLEKHTILTSKYDLKHTSMLRSDLCDYSDAYIVVKGKITVTNPNNNAHDKKLAFKNNAPFRSRISKMNNTTGSLWNYYREEPNSGAVGNINYSIKNSKSFD